MSLSPRELYLDLLKRSLAFTLWPEPPIPIDAFDFQRPPVRRAVGRLVGRAVRAVGLQLARNSPAGDTARHEGKNWPQYADTMIGLKRLDSLQRCVETVLAENIPGDFIETGVWRGGACILIRGVLAAHGVIDRTVWLADSFAGLPEPDLKKWPADKADPHALFAPYLAVPLEQVKENFRRYGLLDDRVAFLPGWFADTLPQAPVRQLALMRLDGDMYGSTMEALQSLYPKLSPGGFCIIDDYALAGCRQAVDDFRREHNIAAPLETIDWTGRLWRK